MGSGWFWQRRISKFGDDAGAGDWAMAGGSHAVSGEGMPGQQRRGLLYDVRMPTQRHFDSARRPVLLGFLLLGWMFVGCDHGKRLTSPPIVGSEDPAPASNIVVEVKFRDQVESNREDDGTVTDLTFVDTSGQKVSLDQYKGKKNVLLVFTRGFSGQLCPYCTTQTSRLIANYDEFTRRDAEVLLVYPGSKEQVPLFKEASIEASGKDSFPFPVLLDEDLAAVNRLGIAAQLAFPSTFLIDKQGKVRLSYVGTNPTDRPSIKALLDQLDSLSP